ncbi:hypothetical protein [Roseovarius mucosus]|uniref:hypothetical protein n=1 Tax=Roseovarius mucosus TaxID=215743 RepID=UPI003BAB047D
MKLRQIEIDFDIHQKIELERRGFDEPAYVALRRLLNLPAKGQDIENQTEIPVGANTSNQPTAGRPFIQDGVQVPHGSNARMEYMRGEQVYEGVFFDGKLVVNGFEYKALSPAAKALAITKTGTHPEELNGWLYWEAQFPGEKRWRKLWDLREEARKKRKS